MTTQRSIIVGIIGVGITAQPFFAQNITKDTQIEDLHPCTHFVSIPATSDPAPDGEMKSQGPLQPLPYEDQLHPVIHRLRSELV